MKEKISDKIIAALYSSNNKKQKKIIEAIGCSPEEFNAAEEELLQKKVICKKQGGVIVLLPHYKIYHYLLNNAAQGESVGNQTIRNALKLNNDDYWNARNTLLEQGKISLGKGKGGSIALVIEEKQKNNKEENTLTTTLLPTLERGWIPDKLAEDEGEYFTVNTSCQGSKKTGGKWSRPDLTLCRYKKYTYLPPRIEITTFEVKKKNTVDVTCVYEALSQNNAAHYSYVLLERVEGASQCDEQWEIILDTAQRHGIGVISFSNARNYDTWNTEMKAAYHEASPENIDRFISQQLQEEHQKIILNWINGK